MGRSTCGRAIVSPPSAPSTALAFATPKSAYLKKREDHEVEANGQDEHAPAAGRQLRSVHQNRHPVVERDRRQHQEREPAAAGRVENHAGDGQDPVRIPLVGAADKCQSQQRREKQKEKDRFSEEHKGNAKC